MWITTAAPPTTVKNTIREAVNARRMTMLSWLSSSMPGFYLRWRGGGKGEPAGGCSRGETRLREVRIGFPPSSCRGRIARTLNKPVIVQEQIR